MQGSRLVRSIIDSRIQVSSSIHRHILRETQESMERYLETEMETETETATPERDVGGRGKRPPVPVDKVQWRAAGADGSQGEEETARIGRRWRRVARRDPV